METSTCKRYFIFLNTFKNLFISLTIERRDSCHKYIQDNSNWPYITFFIIDSFYYLWGYVICLIFNNLLLFLLSFSSLEPITTSLGFNASGLPIRNRSVLGWLVSLERLFSKVRNSKVLNLYVRSFCCDSIWLLPTFDWK